MSDEQLIQEYKNGNREVIDSLIKNFSNKMKALSSRYEKYAKWYGVGIEDLQQEGWIAFIDCIDKYEVRSNDSNNCSFSSFAWVAVDFGLKNAIRKNKPFGYKNKRHDEAKNILKSIDSPINEDLSTLHDIIADPYSQNCFDNLLLSEYIISLRSDLLQLFDDIFGIDSCYEYSLSFVNSTTLVEKLTKGITAKEVILLHYGMYGQPMTFLEISEKAGLTASYIGELEKQGMWRIRNSIVGQQFMKKYEDEHIGYLKLKKESIDVMKNPEMVNLEMEFINELLQKYA